MHPGTFRPSIRPDPPVLDAAHLFNDLVELDPSSMSWIDRSYQVRGTPEARYCAGLAAAGGRLCLFGGIRSNANQGYYAAGEL